MDKQEIFDKVWAGFEKQGWVKSTNGAEDFSKECRYRGVNNTCCAVGILIPDSLYDPIIEGVSVEEINWSIRYESFDRSRLKLKNIIEALGLKEETDFLSEMQFWHDNNNEASLKKNFIELAERYNLKIPETVKG